MDPSMSAGQRIRVGLLFGGRSVEHEVSIASATSILRALDPQKYEPVPVGIDKQGRWWYCAQPPTLTEVFRRGRRVFLLPEPGSAGLRSLDANDHPVVVAVDVFFPVLHGTFGEDGTVQGLLELAGIPYVGAGVLASAVGMDKDVQKRLFDREGLPVVTWLTVHRADWEKQPQQILAEIRRQFRMPVFVKPATLGSSVGMTRVQQEEALEAAIVQALAYAEKILIERAVDAREIEVSVLGNEEPQASLPGEIVPHREFYDYAAKYLEPGTELLVPAPLLRRQVLKLQTYAVRAFRAIGAEGMARVDFFLERPTGRIYINEINTIPGFTAISMYPRLWEASGLGYRELIDRLIALALERHRQRQRTRYSYDPPPGSAGVLG